MDEQESLVTRFRRIESSSRSGPLQSRTAFSADARVPPVSGIRLATKTTVGSVSQIVLTWGSPSSSNIDHFELWLVRSDTFSKQPVFVGSVKDSPANCTVNAAPGTSIIVFVTTVLKTGLNTALNAAPSISFQI